MNIVMILIVAWTFFVATNQVIISETNVGHTVENSEAILQENDVTVMNTEEGIPIFVKFNYELNPIRTIMRNDKAFPST